MRSMNSGRPVDALCPLSINRRRIDILGALTSRQYLQQSAEAISSYLLVGNKGVAYRSRRRLMRALVVEKRKGRGKIGSVLIC